AEVLQPKAAHSTVLPNRFDVESHLAPNLAVAHSTSLFARVVQGACWPPAGNKRNFSGSATEIYRLAPTTKRLGVVPANQCVSAMAFSPDGSRLAVGANLFNYSAFVGMLPSTINIWALADAASWTELEAVENSADVRW